MKKQFKSIAYMVLGVILLNCEQMQEEKIGLVMTNNSDHKVGANWYSDSWLLEFESVDESEIITSRLIIRNSRDASVNIELKSNVDIRNSSYKLRIHKTIVEEAVRLKDQMGPNEWTGLSIEFERFGKALVNTPGITSKQNLHSIFYHNSIINTIRRSALSKKECECTPHPGFLLDK